MSDYHITGFTVTWKLLLKPSTLRRNAVHELKCNYQSVCKVNIVHPILWHVKLLGNCFGYIARSAKPYNVTFEKNKKLKRKRSIKTFPMQHFFFHLRCCRHRRANKLYCSFWHKRDMFKSRRFHFFSHFYGTFECKVDVLCGFYKSIRCGKSKFLPRSLCIITKISY